MKDKVVFNFEYSTVRKLANWAESLPDDIDFIDYWFNLFQSKTKYEIESNIANNINAFYWTRWQEDFEEFVDGYKPKKGNGFGRDARHWFAGYMQYLVYAFNTSGRDIADHYGLTLFNHVMDGWIPYHTFGVDLFVEHIVDKFGLPPGVDAVTRLYM